MSDNSLVDIDAAASYLSVRPGYLRRLVRERRIPYLKVGKFVRFRVSDLERWLDASRAERLR